jgi:hypothetical protein
VRDGFDNWRNRLAGYAQLAVFYLVDLLRG